VRANTLAVAQALRDAGAIIEEVDLRVPRKDVMRAIAIHFHHGFAADIAADVDAHPDLVTPYVTDFLRWAREVSDGASYMTGLGLEAQLYAPVGALLERFDALLVPTSGAAGLDAGEDWVTRTPVVGGRTLDNYLENFTTPVFNIMSRCPVLALPSGVGARNAPTSVQLVGRTYDDLTVFRLGAALEAARPWDTWPQVIQEGVST
jgi:Asp-tRNA(Asn)/Glu-tRNA(Gln) amidotransferase A subunit family amidase